MSATSRSSLSALIALTFASGAALWACDDSSTPSGGDATTTDADGFPRDTLVIAVGSDAANLLDVVSQSASDSAIIENIFYPIADAEFECELKYTPAFAKSWEWNEDGTVISMTLRDDIQWQDGTPMTPDDLAFTMELVEDKLVASPRLAYIEYLKPGFRPKIIDATHIEYHFTHAYDRVTQVAHAAVLSPAPKHILKDADRSTLRGNDFNVNPVVSGRWKVAKWDRGQKIVLEPNENWSGPADEKPKLKRVIFKILPEYATRLVELETGAVDLAEGIQIADADRLAKEHPEIKLYRRGWRFMDYIGWNNIDPADFKAKSDAANDVIAAANKKIDAMGLSEDEAKAKKIEVAEANKVDLWDVKPHPLFGDPRVRRALTKAINIDKLVADLLTSEVTGEKYGRPAVSTITPELCKTDGELQIKRLPYDIAMAKAELAAVGWTDSDGDGILDKDGKKFSFTLQTNSENARRAKSAIIVQANLKDIGVDMQIERIEFNTFSEKHRKKDFDATLGGWSAGLFVDPTVIWHSGVDYQFNFVSYQNKEVDALMEKGLREPNPDLSNPIWIEMQAKVYEDQPYTFLFWRDDIVALSARFEDAEINVQSPYGHLHRWNVPADKVKYKR
jgi:peptide/nickel transport system substrate-binding protein